ncbi:MAG: ATP-binding cassette domain-containing protein [Clostridia bacterium]|nr:ATP-binding cassette domain-containing protein [Clostridia bacterium]
MTLTVRDIYKSFGDIKALCGVGFEASAGHPLGLLGRNGAGKTTLMRIIMDILKADSGEILLDGKPLADARTAIGYLPEERGLYRTSRIGEQLIYFARLRGMDAARAKQAVSDTLSRFGIEEYINRTPETLSKGNQQRVQLALAMINRPEILILDEPFSGLDPIGTAQLKEIIRDYAAQGHIVIFSSHQMPVVEDFCEDIVIIKSGRVVTKGHLNDIRNSYHSSRVFIRACGDISAIAQKHGDVSAKNGGIVCALSNDADANELLADLSSSGTQITHFEIIRPSLEEIFISSSGEGGNAQ